MRWASYGSPDGSDIFPAQQTIANDAGLARSTVEEHTHGLRELGVLYRGAAVVG